MDNFLIENTVYHAWYHDLAETFLMLDQQALYHKIPSLLTDLPTIIFIMISISPALSPTLFVTTKRERQREKHRVKRFQERLLMPQGSP